jgi:hypothetical protein
MIPYKSTRNHQKFLFKVGGIHRKTSLGCTRNFTRKSPLGVAGFLDRTAGNRPRHNRPKIHRKSCLCLPEIESGFVGGSGFCWVDGFRFWLHRKLGLRSGLLRASLGFTLSSGLSPFHDRRLFSFSLSNSLSPSVS